MFILNGIENIVIVILVLLIKGNVNKILNISVINVDVIKGFNCIKNLIVL